MLPLCSLCPCCPSSSLEPVTSLWLRAHTLASPQGLPGKSTGTFATQCHREMRGKVCSGQYGFFAHPPHPTGVLPAKLLKMVNHQQNDPKKIPVWLQSQRWTFESNICCILWEGKEDLCPQQTWAVPGKDIEKNYRSAVSLHKSDKGCGIINTYTHPPSLKLFFILISDFKRLIS